MKGGPRAGLTPTGLLIAFALAVVFAFLFFVWANKQAEEEKRRVTIRRMLEIETALQKYCADCAGALPTQKQGLRALYERPADAPKGWAGPYVEDPEVLRDGWGRPFKYFQPGRLYAGSKLKRPYNLASYGRDGREGGRGVDRDIVNWDRKTLLP